MEFFWELGTQDDSTYQIPPEAVDKVKAWMATKDAVLLKSAVIPYAQIKYFRPTSRAYSSVPLIEAAAQAFKEPIVRGDSAVDAKWVKKAVTQREYNTYYSKIPSYYKLAEDSVGIWVCFLLATHDINPGLLQECTPDEAATLNQLRNQRN